MGNRLEPLPEQLDALQIGLALLREAFEVECCDAPFPKVDEAAAGH